MSQQKPPTFLLDTNVFIGAHNAYYQPTFCPAFWDCLLHHFNAGRLLSIDRVKIEITKPNDLVLWTSSAPAALFTSTRDQQVIAAYATILNWVQNHALFTPAAIGKFASVPEGWLVAYAQVHNAVVVTHEANRPDAKSRVHIPNVCQQFNVPYCNTFDMLRQLGVRFEFASNP